MKLQGKDIYLDTLERKDCHVLWHDNEYDFAHPNEALNLGLSEEKADEWFESIQKAQGKSHLRLGIFLPSGKVIGDIALQDIDWKNRNCTIGMGFAKLESRCMGYGKQALRLMLSHGFGSLGLERISANTLCTNIAAQKSLVRCGFILEGTERKAVYQNGCYYDRMCYAILKADYLTL